MSVLQSPLRPVRASALLLAALVAVPVAEGQHGHGGDLGHVDFGAPCAEAVRADFDRAVALLHHMQYVEARAAFEAVAETDPGCAMARWGAAMTLFQPLWPSRPSADDLARGSGLLSEARALGVAGRDEALVAAAEAFYADPEADWWGRLGRWADAMAEAHADHPDDLETSALYALSVLAAAPLADDQMARHAHAADVLLGVYDREPTHPGAVHYTIHANDVDGRSGEALDVVRSYAGIAPSVPHALHMPSHIFVRLGEWPDVIEWNRRSAEAALRSPAGGAVSHHWLHAVDYLVYAHLQRGEDAEARALLERVRAEEAPFQSTFISAFHLGALPARLAVERRAWDEAAALDPRSPASVDWDRFWWPEALGWFASGLGAVHTGDSPEAVRAVERLAALRDAADGAGEAAFADYIEGDRLVLAAWRAHAAGDADAAVRLAREAAAHEATLQKHPVTPGALYPAAEALGDLLVALDRPEDALDAYERSLATWPGRYHSLLGAARAAHAAGLADRARAHYRALLDATAGATSGRAGLEEAREHVGG